jgi:hypothetical protein
MRCRNYVDFILTNVQLDNKTASFLLARLAYDSNHSSFEAVLLSKPNRRAYTECEEDERDSNMRKFEAHVTTIVRAYLNRGVVNSAKSPPTT